MTSAKRAQSIRNERLELGRVLADDGACVCDRLLQLRGQADIRRYDRQGVLINLRRLANLSCAFGNRTLEKERRETIGIDG